MMKKMMGFLGKQSKFGDVEEQQIEYALKFQRTLTELEAKLHESDNADDIIKHTLKTACDFYGGDWAGFLEADLDLGIWAPYVWYNPDPADRTMKLIREFEEANIMSEWLKAMNDNTAVAIRDTSNTPSLSLAEQEVYRRLSVKSLLAVPVKPRPFGFLVVRNPRQYLDQSDLLQMLAFVVLAIVNEKKLVDSLQLAFSPDSIQNDRDIIVNLFGSLEIYTSKGVLKEADIKSPKILRLISYLLLNPKSSVPSREIAEKLWPDEDMEMDAVSNNVRGMLFRLRQSFGLICGHSLIETTPNGYRINPKLHITTDLEQFDKYCNAALRALSTSDKVELLKEAMSIYKGKVLSSADGEHWVMPVASHYSLRYIGIVNELLRILAETGDIHNLHKYASHSLTIEPGNMNAHYWLIYAMVHMGASEMAKSAVNVARSALTDEEYEDLVSRLRKIEGTALSNLFHMRDLPE